MAFLALMTSAWFSRIIHIIKRGLQGRDALGNMGEYPKLCVWYSVHAVGTGHLLNR
jgi:hypothetical protein